MNLPQPVQAYLTAHANRDADAMAAIFAPDATVTDEGKTFTGTQEILAWRRHASTEWTYTSEITGTRREGETWIVALHLEGNFPGGVADLEQQFTVRDNHITTLHIG